MNEQKLYQQPAPHTHTHTMLVTSNPKAPSFWGTPLNGDFPLLASSFFNKAAPRLGQTLSAPPENEAFTLQGQNKPHHMLHRWACTSWAGIQNSWRPEFRMGTFRTSLTAVMLSICPASLLLSTPLSSSTRSKSSNKNHLIGSPDIQLTS